MRTSNGIPQQLEILAREAIEVVRQLLRDPGTPPSVRLRAAKLIITAAQGGGDDDEPTSKTHLVPHARGPKPERAA